MSTKQERADERREGQEAYRRDCREQESRDGRLKGQDGLVEDVVTHGVLAAVGRPPGFLRATARLVRPGRYRVNVLVGPHAGDTRVARSYFVATDGEGRVLDCSPPLAWVDGAMAPA